LDGVIVNFDQDEGVVLGLSVSEDLPEEVLNAWTTDLMVSTNSAEAFYAVESPPPTSLQEWNDAMASDGTTSRRIAAQS
jgi:hypothetical protein